MRKQKKISFDSATRTQQLSDFIYDLNIVRRKLSLYPEHHPEITNSCEIVLNLLKKLCQSSAEITLEVAPGILIFEQTPLDEITPAHRDCARFFSTLGVASISFHKDLETEELIRFNQIATRDKEMLETEGGVKALLQTHNIQHISVIPVDYSYFQMGEITQSPDKEKPGELWQTFLKGLLHDKTGQKDQERAIDSTLNAEQVARNLNQGRRQESDHPDNHGEAIQAFISGLKHQSQQANKVAAKQLNVLIQNLNPELKHNFLKSTFQALNQGPEESGEILSSLPQELITASLEQHSCQQLDISARLVDLLGQFSTTATQQSSHSATTSAPLSEGILKARVELLLFEDNHDEYVPNDYQQALSQILTGMVKSDIEPKTAMRLKTNLEKQSVERHCCTILFNLLNNRVKVKTERQIQDHLVELSRFFFDTGDFISLQEIYLHWSEYLYSGTASARFLDEKVLSSQTRESFMNEVLDSIQLWGAEKYDDICRYISEVGEAYAELLIHRLGIDEQAAQRRTWMKVLVELGSKGHQIIVKALEDKRWFLVRNLLIVLGQQKDIIPIKAVHQLTGHPHPRVRQEALRILFRYNPATANRLLLKELSSGNRESLTAAIPLAENSQDSKVLHQLHQLIQAEINSDSDLELTRQLLQTLAFLGKPQSIPVLAKLLKKKGFLRSRRQKDFHRDIVNHLGSFPSQVSEPLLNSIIKGHDRALKQLARTQLQSYQHAEGRA